MPVRVGKKNSWQIIQTTADWQTMQTSLKKDELEVATGLYYVNIAKE